MKRTRWGLASGPVLTGVVAATLALTGCSSGGDGSGSDPDSTASATSGPLDPADSPTPPGFLPVDSLDASAVPWDAVGPGWFLVDWAEQDAPRDPEGRAKGPADASVSLLSPEGTWYAVASLQATGSDESLAWLGNTVAVFRTSQAPDDGGWPEGDTSLVNLRTGASRQVLSAGAAPAWDAVGTGGSLVGLAYEVDSVHDHETHDMVWYDAQNQSHPICGEGGGRAGSLAPDRARVVCFNPTGDADSGVQTAVGLGTVGSTAAPQVIDTFRLDPDRYGIVGWLDGDTFILVRYADNDAPNSYFSYNVVTRRIADYLLPFTLSDYLDFDSTTQTFANMEYGSGDVQIIAVDGTPITEVTCAEEGWFGPIYSGTNAVVVCEAYDAQYAPTGATLTLVNLVDGTTTVVADVPESADRRIRAVYAYVGNLD